MKIIHRKGPDCPLFKCDLSRAYRQLKVDLGDVHKLGYCFKGKYYFNLALPMGLGISSEMLSDGH